MGFLNIPEEDLEAHLWKKYTDPLTDTSLRCLNELNRPQPPEETFDDSPLKLGEIKLDLNITSTKDALKY